MDHDWDGVLVVVIVVVVSSVSTSAVTPVWAGLIAEMLAVRLADLTACNVTTICVTDHEAASVHGVESHEREGVELASCHLQISVLVTVQVTKDALVAVSLVLRVLCIVVDVIVVLMTFVVFLVVLVVVIVLAIMIPSLAVTMRRGEHVTHVSAAVADVAVTMDVEGVTVAS